MYGGKFCSRNHFLNGQNCLNPKKKFLLKEAITAQVSVCAIFPNEEMPN